VIRHFPFSPGLEDVGSSKKLISLWFYDLRQPMRSSRSSRTQCQERRRASHTVATGEPYRRSTTGLGDTPPFLGLGFSKEEENRTPRRMFR